MNETNDSHASQLRPAQLSALWGIGERMVRKVLAELEALGFKLGTDEGGARVCSPGLAEAVRVCRSQKKELAALRLDPAASRFLAPGAAADELDPLALLVYVATEISVVREVTGVMANAMNAGMSAGQYRPFSWTNAGLPNPKHSL